MLSPFTGIGSDQEEMEQWLHSFKLYTNIKKMTRLSKFWTIQLLMKDHAAIWFCTLPQEGLCTIPVLIAAFRKRYAMIRLDKYKKLLKWGHVIGTKTNLWRLYGSNTVSSTSDSNARTIFSWCNRKRSPSTLQNDSTAKRGNVIERSASFSEGSIRCHWTI